MGRSRRPLELSTGRPWGQRWTKYRAALVMAWWRAGRACFYCGHPFAAPQLIEVAHLISPIVAPQLSWDRDNLVPSHGAGKRRCPIPECDLNCNWLSHNAPDAPKDENGADLPFTPQFLTRATAARAQFRAKNGNPGNSRGIPAPSGLRWPDAGRPW
jgi:hypothetical protein